MRVRAGERRHLPIEALGIVLVALAAGGVGLLLRWNFAAGSLLFSGALALSVMLRGRGADARVIGRAVALPFIAMLIVPVPPIADLRGRLLTILAALLSLIVAMLAQRVALPAAVQGAPEPPRTSTLKPPPYTRMALQLGAALLGAFAIGGRFFPAHWPWIVLTVYIVCAGARGRADALHKGLLRLGGALVGGIGIVAVAPIVHAGGPATAATLFLTLFAGLALRERSYAFWAAATTIIVGILMAMEGSFTAGDFAARIACILIGAALGIGAAAFIYPIRTSDIARRRLATLLGRFERLADDGIESVQARISLDLDGLRDLEPALALHRRLVTRARADHPADWIAIARETFAHARTVADVERTERASLAARRAIRDRDDVSGALQRLAKTLG